ncbi:MAG: MATE family efflux transporter [Clostridia bacterium]|nr:MATE family efflux transporter [Clostridia bacterium]
MHSKNDLKRQINEVWRLSLPAILTQITTIAMQYIDSAMVGNLGANASAAIGLVSTSTWLLSGMIYAVSAGFSVQVAHEIGAENDMGARNVVKHGLWAALVVSGLTCLIGVLLSNPLPVWLGGEEALHRDASLYFLVFALTMPFMQLNALTSSYLQCCGDMVTPSVLNAIMCVLDVAFNAVFIPMYGVLGAGIGTGLACTVISLVMAYCCCIRNPRLRLRREEKTRMDKEILRKAVRIGLPVAVQEIVMCAANVVATMIIAPLGAVAIAANSFAVTAESLCYMPGYGIGSAATTLVGRSIGAGDEKEAKRFGNICTVMGMAFMTVTGLVMMAICPLVFRMLTPDTAVQALAVKVLRIELLAEPLFAASIVAAGALRGTGDTLVPSLMNLGSIWIVRIGLALLLVGPLGLTGMWIAMAVELCVRGLLMLYRQKTSKYYKVSNKTAENA